MSRYTDPAEETGYLRYFYRNWHPTRFGRFWSHTYAWVAGLGVLPEILVTLQVQDRNSRRLNSVILAAARFQGHRYLVSMLGQGSEWVQNVRAAGGRARLKHGKATPVRLTEIAANESPPILKAWCQVATSGRKHLPVAFDAPESAFAEIAGDFPVFRIDAVDE